MNILLIGCKGNFGSAISLYWGNIGHIVTGVEKGDALPEDLNPFDVCFLAVPVRTAMEYIEKIQCKIIVEVSSVKKPLTRYARKMISIHPMFGPRSIDNPDFQNVIYISDLSPEDGQKTVANLFPGFNVIPMSSKEHDKVMSELLVKPYLLSLIARSIRNDDLQVSGSSFSIMSGLADISVFENRQVLEDTIRLNPHSPEIIRNIRKEAEKLSEYFNADDREN